MIEMYRSRDRYFPISHRPLWNIQKRIFLMVQPALHSLNIHSWALYSHYFDEVLWDDVKKNLHWKSIFVHDMQKKQTRFILFCFGGHAFFCFFFIITTQRIRIIFLHAKFSIVVYMPQRSESDCVAPFMDEILYKREIWCVARRTKSAFNMHEFWENRMANVGSTTTNVSRIMGDTMCPHIECMFGKQRIKKTHTHESVCSLFSVTLPACNMRHYTEHATEVNDILRKQKIP